MTEPPVSEPTDDAAGAAHHSAAQEVAASEVGRDQAEAAVANRPRQPAPTERDLQIAGQLAELRGRIHELELRKSTGTQLMWVMIVQLAIADVAFFWYGLAHQWQIEAAVMQVWVGGAVVHVIGLVWLMVKYLFSEVAAPDGPGRHHLPDIPELRVADGAERETRESGCRDE